MELKTKVTGIILMIVALIIMVTVIGTTASTVDNAADDITQDQRCSDGGCYWNTTASACRTAINSGTACGNELSNRTYPLESLFNTGGIVILLFISAGLIIVVGLAMKGFKK